MKVLFEKWTRDKKKTGFCKYGEWKNGEGRQRLVPEGFFADWVNRLDPVGFRGCVDRLTADGFIELFTGGNLYAFYEVTEKGRKLVIDGELKPQPEVSRLRSAGS
jgi:hypothetical protein